MPEISPTYLRIHRDYIPPLIPAHREVVSTDLGLVDVSFTEPSANSPIIRPLEWSGVVTDERRPDEDDRSAVLARAFGRQVLVAGTPGVAHERGWLNEEIAEQVASGDFSAPARAQWQALRNHLGEDEVHGFGMSQGASSIIAMAAEAKSEQFEKLVLWDPVVAEHISLAGLAIRLVREQKDWGSYKKEMPDWMAKPALPPLDEFLSRRAGNLIYPRGLTKFSFMDNFEKAVEQGSIDRHYTELVLVNGDKSRVAPTKEMGVFANQLQRRFGFSALQWFALENESHGMLDDAGKLSSLMTYLSGNSRGHAEIVG